MTAAVFGEFQLGALLRHCGRFVVVAKLAGRAFYPEVKEEIRKHSGDWFLRVCEHTRADNIKTMVVALEARDAPSLPPEQWRRIAVSLPIDVYSRKIFELISVQDIVDLVLINDVPISKVIEDPKKLSTSHLLVGVLPQTSKTAKRVREVIEPYFEAERAQRGDAR